jgi:hypothetical protein
MSRITVGAIAVFAALPTPCDVFFIETAIALLLKILAQKSPGTIGAGAYALMRNVPLPAQPHKPTNSVAIDVTA